MIYQSDLQSKSQTKVRQAADKITNGVIEGYGNLLLESLNRLIENPKAWKTQCSLIKALAITKHTDAIESLKCMARKKFDSKLVYKELGFAIFILENTESYNIDYLFELIETDNMMLISGACAAMLYSQTIPPIQDIKKILPSINKYTDKEGAILTPRCYIAALAHCWPLDEVKSFLNECKNSNWQGLVEIAHSSLQGKPTKYKLI